MINIFTKKDLLMKSDVVLNDFDDYVNAVVTCKDFSELDIYVIDAIDGAIILDSITDKIKTKYGICSLNDLSSGCKVVLSYLQYKRSEANFDGRVVFNVNECGWNALDVLFDCADRLNDSDTIFLLEHQDELYNCKHRDYLVNGSKVINDLTFI